MTERLFFSSGWVRIVVLREPFSGFYLHNSENQVRCPCNLCGFNPNGSSRSIFNLWFIQQVYL